MDTVIEYPEPENEIESRREEEMQTLFEIRQARRREAEEREDRRRQRREAREQGDWARLQALEQDSRARARARSSASVVTAGSAASSRTNLSAGMNAGLQADSAFLIAELASQREASANRRRVSSVSYADLGLARHDGTRIRADSVESDHRPLLDSAASMGGSRAVSRQNSPGRWTGIRLGHGRNASEASALSIMTVDSDLGEANTPRTSATRSGSDENVPPRLQLTPQSTIDLTDVPSTDPPGYDDEHASPTGEEAPPYTSPVLERGQGIPGMNSLPQSTRTTQHPLSQTQSRDDTAEDPGDETPPSRGRTREVPRLRLSGVRYPPAIEVLSATPVNSVPGSPLEDHGLSRR